VQGLREVELAAHRPLGDLRDLGAGARAVGEELDHLGGDERRVDVHHDEVPGAVDVGSGHVRRVAAPVTSVPGAFSPR
jgi:hypothetical protein